MIDVNREIFPQFDKSVAAVFFDAGHTLLRAHPSVGEIYARETKRLGADVPGLRFEEEARAVFLEFFGRFAADPRSRRSSDERDHEMWREITRILYDRMPELQPVDYERWFRALYRRFGEADAWRFYPDAVPTLGEDHRIQGLYIATGLSGHGFGIGPAVGRVMAAVST